MAEPEPVSPDKSHRIVKNPETFRERAVKAAEAGDKPKRLAQAKQSITTATQPVIKPVSAATNKIFRRKPFTWLVRPLRLLGKIILPVYFRKSWSELKQVTWPTLQQSRQLTSAVLIFAILFGVVIAIVDFGLDKLFRNVLLK